MVVGHPLSKKEELTMNENQETRSESDFGHDQTGTGEPEGAQVNGTESELSVVLKEMAGIKTTLSKLENGLSKVETKVETGLKVLDTKVTAFGTQIDGYNDKIAGQDAKIAGQDSKVDAAIIKTDAQDTKFESQDKVIAGHDSKIESQNNKIAAQDAKIQNAGFNTLHKIIAIIIAAVIFLLQVWDILPDTVKEFLTFSDSEVTKSFLLFLGYASQRYKVTSAGSLFRSII